AARASSHRAVAIDPAKDFRFMTTPFWPTLASASSVSCSGGRSLKDGEVGQVEHFRDGLAKLGCLRIVRIEKGLDRRGGHGAEGTFSGRGFNQPQKSFDDRLGSGCILRAEGGIEDGFNALETFRRGTIIGDTGPVSGTGPFFVNGCAVNTGFDYD